MRISFIHWENKKKTTNFAKVGDFYPVFFAENLSFRFMTDISSIISFMITSGF